MTHQIRQLLLLMFVSLAVSGCSTVKTKQDVLNSTGARRSFASWNVRAAIGTPEEASWSPALELASLHSSELEQLLEMCPAPNPRTLGGDWKGINKGISCAFAGITQDVKSFRINDCCVTGFNKSIHQVPIDHLECCGWRQEVDRKTCQPVTMGNFVVRSPNCCHEPLVLDYTIADNPWNDPSKFLVDELVQVDRNLLLGRAHVKFGMVQVPIAWFILYRDQGSCCRAGCSSSNCCDKPSGESTCCESGPARCESKCCEAPQVPFESVN